MRDVSVRVVCWLRRVQCLYRYRICVILVMLFVLVHYTKITTLPPYEVSASGLVVLPYYIFCFFFTN